MQQKKSAIPWTDFTWNPWQGCQKVSPGCKACYMYREKEIRYKQDPRKVHRSAKATFNKPLKIEARSKIFTCSWSDFYIESADNWRAEAWEIIKETPQHLYQILTKRPERIPDEVIPENACVGVSVESLRYMYRVAELVENTQPGTRKFVSFEPLLANILPSKAMLFWAYELSNIDWFIIGGESGNDTPPYMYRQCKTDWLLNIVELGDALGIPVYVKQLGTFLSNELKLKDRHGRKIEEWPKKLQTRGMPGYMESWNE